MLLSVIIPAYNEEDSIENLLRVIFTTPPFKEVIVVNDASQDKTEEVLQKLEASMKDAQSPPFIKEFRVIHKKTNEGKGAAIRTGLEYVNGDTVLIQDADLELDPREYPKLIEPFVLYGADVVFGSRFRMEGIKRVYRFRRYAINKALTLLSNLLSDLYLTDMETCYKVIKTDIFKSLCITSNRFAIEAEIVAKIARRKDLAVFEVPISYHARTKSQGKKIGLKDGISCLWAIVRFNVFS